jgi:hypothetical protein
MSCVVVDLSLGGAKVCSQVTLPLAAELQLTLNAPCLWEPLVLSASVVWSSPLRDDGRAVMGLRLQPDSGTQMLILARLLAEHG